MVHVYVQMYLLMMFLCDHIYIYNWHPLGLARGLYAGTVPSLAAQVSENAVLFLSYGVCQKAVMYATGKKDILQLSTVENACSGSFAGFFASLVLCPTELVKCKLQAMKEMSAMNHPGTPKSLM